MLSQRCQERSLSHFWLHTSQNIKPWFLKSNFHETFTKSCLALNQSRKGVSDSLPASYGPKMAFLLKFWPFSTEDAHRLPKTYDIRLYFLNPECIRIPWVLALKNFTKKFTFSPISVSRRKKKLRARVRSNLMPPTSHMASFNRHTPKFSGNPDLCLPK